MAGTLGLLWTRELCLG